MPEARITYRDRPRGEPELWAIREGTRAQIKASARDLLRELRQEYKRAVVWVDGKSIKLSEK